jgi:hypothetical protein
LHAAVYGTLFTIAINAPQIVDKINVALFDFVEPCFFHFHDVLSRKQAPPSLRTTKGLFLIATSSNRQFVTPNGRRILVKDSIYQPHCIQKADTCQAERRKICEIFRRTISKNFTFSRRYILIFPTTYIIIIVKVLAERAEIIGNALVTKAHRAVGLQNDGTTGL